MTTVAELLVLCQDQIQKGNGKKEILLSDDDEGNGFHILFYGFTTGDGVKDYGYDPDKQVILG